MVRMSRTTSKSSKKHTKCMYSLHMINLKWFEGVELIRTTVKTMPNV